MSSYWLWAAAAFAAYFVKGLCGFANTLVFTSILGFREPNALISPAELLLGFPPNLIMTVRYWKSIRKDVILTLIACVILGSLPGAFLLKNVSAGPIKVLFGAVVVLLGIDMLIQDRSSRQAREPSKQLQFIVGLISGLLCGLFGIGAPLAAYITRICPDSHSFKGTCSAVFAAENCVRIITYILLGLLTPDILIRVLTLVPVMLCGLAAGMTAGNYLNESLIRKIIIVLLILSGLILIKNSLIF